VGGATGAPLSKAAGAVKAGVGKVEHGGRAVGSKLTGLFRGRAQTSDDEDEPRKEM